MAESFFISAAANAVGTLMVDYLVNPTERGLRYLFRFHKIVQELHHQQNTLSIEQTHLHQKVEEAKLQIQTQVIEKHVEQWLGNAAKALNDVQSLKLRIEENKRCYRWCPNWSWRYRLSKEIEKKTLDISNLLEKAKSIEIIGHRAELPALDFITSEDLMASKSSTAAFEKIMDALKDDKVNMIGVLGMGGVGKTTLVTKVGNRAKELQLFDKVIKIVVSQTPDFQNIQNKLADSLDLKPEKMTIEVKAGELWRRLENVKVLVILDDMWKELSLTHIGIPLFGNGKGCKIILTTRRRNVCDSMKCQVMAQVGVLDKDEAWTLFKMNAGLERAHPDIIKEAEKVAKECQGLPVAIVTVAKALKGTEAVKGWEVARKKLESNRLMEIGDGEEEEEKNAYICLKLSYDYLKKETTKRCFLLCALYPEDHAIDVEDLVRHAWGLELYDKATSIDEVRYEVLAAIKYLKDSCLLLEAKDEDVKRYVNLHDLVRDVALWITSTEESGFMIKTSFGLSNESFETCTALSLLGTERKEFPEGFLCSKLKILLLNNCHTPVACFEGMQELKVLRLDASFYQRGILSSYAFTSLRKLRALHVEESELEKCFFSSVGNLTTLEILSLRGSDIKEFSDELGNLKNLKMLDLTDCYFQSRFPPNLIRSFYQLEELYLNGSNIQMIEETSGEESNGILLELNVLRLKVLSLKVFSNYFPKDFKFPRLERYDISINKPCVYNYNTMSLQIGKVFPLNVVSDLLWNIGSLYVSEIMDDYVQCLTDRAQQKVPVSLILQNLREVRIADCKNLKAVFQMAKVEENGAPLLSRLRQLFLYNLSNLSCIWELPTQDVSLECLVNLTLRNCPSLKSLFSFSLAQSLLRFESLKIDGCHELKQIVEELEGDEEEISSSINSRTPLCFSKFKSLKITNCDGLEYIFPMLVAPQGLRQMIELNIINCAQLKQVLRPPKEKTESEIVLPRLQCLTVINCPQLTDCNAHFEPVTASLQGVRLSAFKGSFCNTEKLTLSSTVDDKYLVPNILPKEIISLYLEDCEDLECLVDTTERHVLTSGIFNNLVELVMKRMSGLKMLCNGQHPKGFLQNLRRLIVEDCGKLQQVFQIDEVFYDREENQASMLSNLAYLELHSAPVLRWILTGPAHCANLRSLKVVIIEDYKDLKSLFSLSIVRTLRLLEELRIASCEKLESLFTELESDDDHVEPNTLFLPNLKTLKIKRCARLEYVFPLALARDLPCPQKDVACLVDTTQEHVPTSGIFSNLENLELEDLPKLRWILKGSNVSLQSLKVVKIISCRELKSLFSFSIVRTLRLLEELIICDCESLESFFMELESDDDQIQPNTLCLPNLKTLKIKRCTRLEYVFPLALARDLPCPQKDAACLVDTTQEHVPTSGIFSNLENLELEDLPKLRWILKGPNVRLQSLKVIKIISCRELTSLFSFSIFRTLRLLEELIICDCENLESFFMELESDDDQIQPNAHYVSLQSLKVVKIISCRELMSLFSFSIFRTLRLLEELIICDCENLESFFMELESDDDQIQPNTLCLPNLKTLEIKRCPRVEYVFPLALAPDLPCLQKVRLFDLRNLSSFIAGKNFLKAPVLENLYVYKCPRLTNSIIQKKVNECVPLKKLTIDFEDCIDDAESCHMVNTQLRQRSPNLEYITVGNFEQLFLLRGGIYISVLEEMMLGNLIWLRDIWKGSIQAATNLRKLIIYDCNKLSYIFPMTLIRSLPQLYHLLILRCKNLEQIFANDDILASKSSQRHDKDEAGVSKNGKEMLIFPQLKIVVLKKLPSIVSFSSMVYHLVFPSLESLWIYECPRMITSFTVDSTLRVHAETEVEETWLEISTMTREMVDISWSRFNSTTLPPYKKEPKESEEPGESREPKESEESKESKGPEESKEPEESEESKELEEPKEPEESERSKELEEPKELEEISPLSEMF